MKILHLSDPHVHRTEEKNKALVESLTFIADAYPEHKVIVTGDIVDSGTEEQFLRAQQLFFPFWDRLFITPGNHDKGLKGNLYSKDSDRMFDKYFATPLDQGSFFGNNSVTVTTVDDVMFIGVDSNIDTNQSWRFASGEITKKQLSQLFEILSPRYDSGGQAPKPAKTVVLYFHHHPFIHSDPFMYLKNAEALAKVIYGKVDVLLFGHKHVPAQWFNRWDIPLILAADSLYSADTANEITIVNKAVVIRPVPIRRLP